jgi:hypothetical protein
MASEAASKLRMNEQYSITQNKKNKNKKKQIKEIAPWTLCEIFHSFLILYLGCYQLPCCRLVPVTS